MATSFFGGNFFGGEFFSTSGPAPEVVATGPGPAGRPSKSRRRVVIGSRLYEVDSLRDVEFLLKRLVREDAEPVTKSAKARVRVVDRVRADIESAPPQSIPVASVEVDWSALWMQLAIQDRAYADALERAIARMEEDDIEAILLALH